MSVDSNLKANFAAIFVPQHGIVPQYIIKPHQDVVSQYKITPTPQNGTSTHQYTSLHYRTSTQAVPQNCLSHQPPRVQIFSMAVTLLVRAKVTSKAAESPAKVKEQSSKTFERNILNRRQHCKGMGGTGRPWLLTLIAGW